MAMSAAHLSAAIRTLLVSHPWANDGPELTQLCDGIATAVVEEVKAALITIPQATAGLGTTTTPGNPVGPSPAPVPISGAIS